MGVIKKQTVRNTAYTYLGVLIGFVTTGLLFPRFLTTSENGLLKLLVSYSMVFGQLATLGMSNVTIKFFPYFRDREKKHHGYLTFILLMSLVGFALFLGLFFLLQPWIIDPGAGKEGADLFAGYITVIIPLTFFTLLFNNLDAYLRAFYKTVSGSFLKEVIQRAMVLLCISLYIAGFVGFKGFVILYSIALCTPSMIMVGLIVASNEFLLSRAMTFKNLVVTNDMTKVAFFGLVTGFSYLAIINIDSIMINHIVGTSLTGIYAITSYFGALVSIPSRGFVRIGASVIANAFKENDLDTIGDIYHRSCLTQFVIGVLILLGLWLNIDNVFQVLPSSYLPGKYVILFIGISNLIVMGGGANTIIIANSPFYKFSAYATVLLVVLTVLFNWMFIPLYGISGAAFASALSMFTFNLVKFLIIYIKLRLHPYDLKFVYTLGIGLIVYFLVSALPQLPNLFLNIIWISGVTTVLFLVPVLVFKISPDVNDMYRKALKRIPWK